MTLGKIWIFREFLLFVHQKASKVAFEDENVSELKPKHLFWSCQSTETSNLTHHRSITFGIFNTALVCIDILSNKILLIRNVHHSPTQNQFGYLPPIQWTFFCEMNIGRLDCPVLSPFVHKRPYDPCPMNIHGPDRLDCPFIWALGGGRCHTWGCVWGRGVSRGGAWGLRGLQEV